MSLIASGMEMSQEVLPYPGTYQNLDEDKRVARTSICWNVGR